MIAIGRRGPRGVKTCRHVRTGGVAAGKEFGHLAQRLPTARNSRTDRPDGKVYERCGFVVSHSLQSDEQYYRPLLFRQCGESALQIAKLEPHGLIGRNRRAPVRFLQFGAGALARLPASETDILMMQDGEQPRPEIGPLFPQVHFPERSGEALLDEIVCGYEVARQNPRIPRQTRKQGLQQLVKILSGCRLSRLIGILFRRTAGVAVYRSRVGSTYIRNARHRLCSVRGNSIP
jgi:hypothetical protein